MSNFINLFKIQAWTYLNSDKKNKVLKPFIHYHDQPLRAKKLHIQEINQEKKLCHTESVYIVGK